MMGVWFLGTAISQFVASLIAKSTSVSQDGGGGQLIPPPVKTVMVYGNVYGYIAIAAAVCGLILFVLVPWLKRWEHPGVQVEQAAAPVGFPVQKAE